MAALLMSIVRFPAYARNRPLLFVIARYGSAEAIWVGLAETGHFYLSLRGTTGDVAIPLAKFKMPKSKGQILRQVVAIRIQNPVANRGSF